MDEVQPMRDTIFGVIEPWDDFGKLVDRHRLESLLTSTARGEPRLIKLRDCRLYLHTARLGVHLFEAPKRLDEVGALDSDGSLRIDFFVCLAYDCILLTRRKCYRQTENGYSQQAPS